MEPFGETLRRLRVENDDMSLRQLAKRAHLNPGYLSRIENGQRQPSAEAAAALDTALDAAGRLRTAAEAAALAPPPALDDDQEERLVAAANTPSRVDGATVDSLAEILSVERRIEDSVGSAPLILPVRARMAMLAPMVLGARGPVRPKLVSVAAQWAQFAGWLHAAASTPGEANAWLDRAAEWATEVGDANLMACILGYRGHIAWRSGNLGPMIGLSQASQRDGSVYAGQLAYGCQQEARGHAVAGDADATDRKLDEAAELISRTQDRMDERPPWMYFQAPAFLDLQRGVAYRYLGRTDPVRNRQATDLLTRGLAELPPDMRRSEWAAAYVCHRAVTHIQAGDPVSAAADIVEAAEIAAATASADVRGRAARLYASLAKAWPDEPAVTALRALLLDR